MKTIEEIPGLAALLQDIDETKPHTLLNPPPESMPQRGECCKLYALQSVMSWLYQTDAEHPRPPVVRRQKNLSISGLRKQAKTIFHSQVGEIYSSETLKNLATLNGYDTSQLIDSQNIINDLVTALQNGFAPIVIFDVDLDLKGPGNFNSAHEHAAVLCGSYYDKSGVLWFLATCWGSYYSYRADKLADSISQLEIYRTPETFVKMDGEWRSSQRVNLSISKNFPIRRAAAVTQANETFRNKIILIGSSKQKINRLEFVTNIHAIKESALQNVKHLRQSMPEAKEDLLIIQQPHFIPLAEIITFFNLNLTRPIHERFSDQEFNEFLQLEKLTAAMHYLMKVKFNPPIDDSLEGDIYNQNKLRSRSIIEEVSNSIDAKPDAIYCILRDGYYEVREVNGVGMSPTIVCNKYLPPKETTKTNSEKQIGRFGIGSFTKLAHLNNENARIIVTTRAQGHPGIQLEYRLYNGQIYLAMTCDDSIAEYGTITRVFSDEIVEHEYTKTLFDHIEQTPDIPMYLNDKVYSPNKHPNQASVYLNNICIQRYQHAADSATTNVRWDLPANTTIAEGRDKIILDTETIRQYIRNLIDAITEQPSPDWFLYANTIAPLVEDLQSTNTSLYARDNVLDYLINIVHKKLAVERSVPDVDLYNPLMIDGIIRLHPIIAPKNWLERIAQVSQDWDNKVCCVYIAELSKGINTAEPFFHDKDANRVFIDKEYYQFMANNNRLPLLEFIFTYPDKEINAKLIDKTSGLSTETKTTTVEFIDELSRHPYHGLYRRHGVLWCYGEEATSSILAAHPEAKEILRNATSLISMRQIVQHRASPVSTYKKSLSIDGPNRDIASISYDGKLFYFDNYFSPTLYDEHFNPLFHPKWRYLQSKIYLTLKHRQDLHAISHMKVTLDNSDIFIVPNQATNRHELCNLLGEPIAQFSQSLDNERYLSKLSEEYYILTSPSYKQTLFHKTKGYIHLEECYYPMEVIANGRYIGYSDRNKFKTMYALPSGKKLFQTASDILFSDNYFIGVTDQSKQFADIDGNIIAELSIHSGEIIYFHCEKLSDTHLIFSLLDHYGSVHCVNIASHPKKEIQYFKPNNSLGFPVKVCLTEDKENFIIKSTDVTSVIKFDKKNHSVAYFQSPSHTRYYDSYYQHEAAPVSYYFKENFFVIFNKHNTIILDKYLTPLSVNLGFNVNEIKGIVTDSNFYIITRTNKSAVLLDQNGKICFESSAAIYLLNVANETLIYSNNYIYTMSGLKVNTRPCNMHNVGVLYSKPVIQVYYTDGQKPAWDLIDFKGQKAIPEDIVLVDICENTQFIRVNFWDVLYTSYGKMTNAELRSGSPKYDILDVKWNDLILSRAKQLYTFAGYPYFSASISSYYRVLQKHILVTGKFDRFPLGALMRPLTSEQLQRTDVLEKLKYLNSQTHLDAYEYSLCLRFIDWPLAALREIVPYQFIFSFTPPASFADDYQNIIAFSKKLSLADQALLLKTFNLIISIIFDNSPEPVADKLIVVVQRYGMIVLRNLFEILEKNQFDLRVLGADFEKSKPIINEMPNVLGQICFYLFYSAKSLLAVNPNPMTRPYSCGQQISFVNLMNAYMLNSGIFDLSERDASSQLFIDEVKRLGDYADKSHAIRLLQHAVYHQADPNKNLYEREFLQNAIDAYATNQPTAQIPKIHVSLFCEDDRCVFRMEDNGMGMSLRDVFEFYCLVGKSSKRKDRHQRFIGGHGVGNFTAYPNAAKLRLKTGQGDGLCHYFEFMPQYQDGKIIDILATWVSIPELFSGVVVERVAMQTSAILDAAKHQRTFQMHAKTVNADIVVITLNDEPVNKPLEKLSEIILPDFGKLVLYRSIEDMISCSGLSVRPIGQIDSFISPEIRSLVRKQGIIIDLPKSLPVNRERTDFIDAQKVYEFLQPYLLNAYLEAYVRLFVDERSALDELPYDFFEKFQILLDRNTDEDLCLAADAKRIMQHQPLTNYLRYHDRDNLHMLLAYLPLFSVNPKLEKSNNEFKICEISDEKYSLFSLAKYYVIHKKLPDLKYSHPCITKFTKNYNQVQNSIRHQKQCAAALKLGKIPNVTWTSNSYMPHLDWQLIIYISEFLANCFGHKVNIGFSALNDGSLMVAIQNSKYIHWNVFAVSNPDSFVYRIIRTLLLSPQPVFIADINAMLNVISHELVHAILETSCNKSHNRAFAVQQRKLLTALSTRFGYEEIQKGMSKIRDEQKLGEVEEYEVLKTEPFIKSQLFSPASLKQLYTLFGFKPDTVEHNDVTPDSNMPLSPNSTI